MDVDRLKNGTMFTDEYFDRQLECIREIRLSERKFYQKVTDLYATAFDYDKDAKTTRLFFETVQNKMNYIYLNWKKKWKNSKSEFAEEYKKWKKVKLLKRLHRVL